MNILVTSSDPGECAEALDDTRVEHVTREMAALLSTALHLTWREQGREPFLAEQLYPPTDEADPCTRWALKRENFRWLHTHALLLAFEHVSRLGKIHESMAVIDLAGSLYTHLAEGRSPFVNRSAYDQHEDVYRAYRLTLIDWWQSDDPPPVWTRRAPPAWCGLQFLQEGQRSIYCG